MKQAAGERRTAVIVVSAWREGERGPLRARVHKTLYPSRQTEVSAAAGVQEICRRVCDLITAFGDAAVTDP